MIQTRFLASHEYEGYRQWLLERDSETLTSYFGIITNETFINNLVDKIIANPQGHNFLIALIDNEWVGVIHMAKVSDTVMEFGVMVSESHRNRGVADELMSEAIVWIRNRGYDQLYLHCLNNNSAMKHLADKHGLSIQEKMGEIDSMTRVPPPSLVSYIQEASNCQKNIFFINLRKSWSPFSEIYG